MSTRLPVPYGRPAGSSSELLLGAAAGLAGGLAGAWAMERFQAGWSRLTGDAADAAQDATGYPDVWVARTQDQLSGVPAATARSVERIFGPLDPGSRASVAPVLHYAFGGIVGACYGALAEARPEVTRGFGIPFGLAVWSAADEVAVPALGLSASPLDRPLPAHGYAFLTHVVFGLTTEGIRRALRGR